VTPQLIRLTIRSSLRAVARIGTTCLARPTLTAFGAPPGLKLLRSASVFAVPSFRENFGLGALEAMACGVPVLVSRGVNLAPAIAQADAGWITGTDDEEIAATLTEAMRDEVGRRRRAANARKLASNYTWDSAAALLEVWYMALTPRLTESTRN